MDEKVRQRELQPPPPGAAPHARVSPTQVNNEDTHLHLCQRQAEQSWSK